MAIGQLYFVKSNAGKRFFLYMLLTVVIGATNYNDLRSVDGTHHNTFKAASVAGRLYKNNDEWKLCLCEAAAM